MADRHRARLLIAALKGIALSRRRHAARPAGREQWRLETKSATGIHIDATMAVRHRRAIATIGGRCAIVARRAAVRSIAAIRSTRHAMIDLSGGQGPLQAGRIAREDFVPKVMIITHAAAGKLLPSSSC